jgi:hypothetical protein
VRSAINNSQSVGIRVSAFIEVINRSHGRKKGLRIIAALIIELRRIL